jgi:hypothetical protein
MSTYPSGSSADIGSKLEIGSEAVKHWTAAPRKAGALPCLGRLPGKWAEVIDGMVVVVFCLLTAYILSRIPAQDSWTPGPPNRRQVWS